MTNQIAIGAENTLRDRERGTKKGKVGREKIGEILLSQGKITHAQLEDALLVQAERDTPLKFGQVLLFEGYVSEVDLAMALAQKFRLEYVEITEHDVDPDMKLSADRKFLRKHGMLPLRVEEGRLVVAMSDPTNFYAIEDLTMISGYRVTPVVAVAGQIQRIFQQALRARR
jgi:type IV pilus assembly protein PilB